MWNEDMSSDRIIVNAIVPIYKTVIVTKTVKGEKIKSDKTVLVKELRMKKWLLKIGITQVDEYLTSKNEISKSRAIIYDKFSNKFYCVDHSPTQIIKWLKGPVKTKIGF